MDEEERPLSGGGGGVQSSTCASESKMIVSSSNPLKRNRNRRSSIWSSFKLEKDEQGNERAFCNKCSKSYLWLPNSGTSNLLRHYDKCDGQRKIVMLDEKVAREKFSRVIIRHNLPFRAVEYEELREYLSYLNPNYKPYTRNTAAADVFKTWEKEKQKLKCELEKISSRVCLTSDCWTTSFGDGYIVLTAHYVDAKWILNSKILSFCDMPPPHTGVALASKIHDCLKEWGIEKKVFSLTLDNATANNSLQETLRDRLNLDDDLLCRGEFFHVRCCAHILNLIVQDGLEVIVDALAKIRETVKYLKGSKSRRIALGECIEVDGEVTLSLDVPHRWNSTYSMLEKALKYERALNRFKVVDKNYKHCPSSQDWKRGKIIHSILMPFDSITSLMSGRSYSTANLYFGHVWKIQCLLEVHKYHEDGVISEMISKMRIKFDKYWEQYSVILAMGAVLDPRMKFRLLKRCYDELDPLSSQAKIDHLKSNLYKLFEEYRRKFPLTPVVSTSKGGSFVSDQRRRNLGVQDDLFELDDGPDYMEEGKSALDMLSIPITTVASESSFSIGSQVINKYRSRLLPSNVQALICTRSWIHGYMVDDEENDGEIVTIRSMEEHSTEGID